MTPEQLKRTLTVLKQSQMVTLFLKNGVNLTGQYSDRPNDLLHMIVMNRNGSPLPAPKPAMIDVESITAVILAD